ncbi:MAG: diacylglycerol/polyprenol kinase family protein [Candidatus Woesearchaeota archaeon]
MRTNNQLRRSAEDFFNKRFNTRNPYREVKRQLFHFIMGIFIIFSVILFSNFQVAVSLTLVLIVGGVLSLLTKAGKTNLLDFFLEHFDRDDDKKLFPGKGAFFYIFGCTMVLFIFPENVALASIAILAVGDSVSHLAGTYIRKHMRDDGLPKVIEGTLFGIILSSIAASFFVDPLFAFIASAMAMAAETTEDVMFRLDDNFYIPLIASVTILLLRLFFG